MTQKRFVLSQYLGGIERNSTNHIVKAEATSMSYGVKFNPVLNQAAGRLVGLVCFYIITLFVSHSKG